MGAVRFQRNTRQCTVESTNVKDTLSQLKEMETSASRTNTVGFHYPNSSTFHDRALGKLWTFLMRFLRQNYSLIRFACVRGQCMIKMGFYVKSVFIIICMNEIIR